MSAFRILKYRLRVMIDMGESAKMAVIRLEWMIEDIDEGKFVKCKTDLIKNLCLARLRNAIKVIEDQEERIAIMMEGDKK